MQDSRTEYAKLDALVLMWGFVAIILNMIFLVGSFFPLSLLSYVISGLVGALWYKAIPRIFRRLNKE